MQKPLDLFLLAGQSNMQGYMGDAAWYPDDEQGDDEHIRFYWNAVNISSSERQWTTLKPQGGRFPAGHFGPEISFARLLRQSGLNPAIFKFCCPTTSLAEHWLYPGQNGLYDKLCQELAHAIGVLRAQGLQINYQMTIWIQGESDARTPEMAAAYEAHLHTLITHFRESVLGLSDRQGVFLLSIDAQHPYCQRNPEVVAAQKSIARRSSVGYVPMIGLPKADESHLTPQGLVMHGKRLFDVYAMIAQAAKPASR